MYELQNLPYDYNALEPYIDEATMRVHHDGHYATYLANLNKIVEFTPEYQNIGIAELIKKATGLTESASKIKLLNQLGGYFNHSLFWKMMSPKRTGADNRVANLLGAYFGDVATFKEKFTEAAMGVFGSGWCWLVRDKSAGLSITTTPNQDCPVFNKEFVVLGLDLWEHAYYLKYQNKRLDYINAWWNVVNWDFISENIFGIDKI